MAWNPDTYNRFKSERFTPFYDLLALAKSKPEMEVIDLGCGTGELTRKLADALPGARVTGIDSSEQMLSQSQDFVSKQVIFKQLSIERFLESDKKWDLVFSNAAIQWVDDHETVFPKIISSLKENGQLLIQMPDQHHNVSNRLLDELAEKEPFREVLKGWKRVSPVLDIDRYSQILFENGSKSMTVFEKIYPLVLSDADALFDWVSGTALIPYSERLESKIKQDFIDLYRKFLQNKFAKSPVFYPFRRIILEANF
ncbi:methyltransferase domain-containing protein [Dyadobacter psychrotolerans]|uniref:Methyltransferase domain-containing protein n=1 Tax=Dyadobacter psychrotolerans TaxID=2541721 RepID=A0A4V2Z4M2_9BACT|nr:methyltransferase domain-containing protein [Dyadobacter psychrotolerans]TDE17218.1 methyltransferase domain-containing protein [Dyadobacter psychrotolerans]